MTHRGPAYAYLLPTGRCNLHCSGCYATLEEFGRKSRLGELSIDDYRQVIGELLQMGARTFDISGGEPLLYPHLVELCQAIRAHPQARVWLVTNGTIGGEEDFLRLSRCVNRLVFSFDGPYPALHDQLRGSQGAFARTLKMLRAARAMPFEEIAINFIVCRPNVDSAGEMLALAQAERVDRLALLTFRDVSENGALFDLIPPLADLQGMWRAAADFLARSSCPAYVDLVVPAFLFPESTAFRRSLPAEVRSRIVLHHPNLRAHSAYRETLVVKPFGTLSGDTAMINQKEFDLGSVREGVALVWDLEAPRWRARLAEREAALRAREPCGSCPRWHYCRGGCPAAALHQWSDLMRHDRSCDQFREHGDF
jgi:radical SAM protein with 4Fe4S-binding SPASM domain